MCSRYGFVAPQLGHRRALPRPGELARRVVKQEGTDIIWRQHVDLDDLVSAGVVGLIDAFSRFDHTKKVQFKSYAQFRIRGAILDSLRTLDWSPRELRRKGRAVEEAIRSVTQKVGRAPSEQEIVREMDLDLSEYQLLLGELKGLEIGSLHMERTEDSAFGPVDRIGQLTMRNLDIADSRARLEQYAGVGMVGTRHQAPIGAAQAASTGLIGAMDKGGAEAIASRGEATDEGSVLDRAAMESGTD